jgi:hypothetical protein
MVGTPVELRGVGRDLRIDFFRGLALFMIIFDHVPGDPLSKFTYARLGFSDAAEIFVFLSGVSCGIVYPRVLLRQGVGVLLKRVSWRALQIYTYYLVASLVTILIIVVSRDLTSIPDNHQAFIALPEDPLAAIRSAIFLVSPPDIPGILVLYLELTLFIPLFILTAARSSAAALAISGGLWLLAQVHPDLFPHTTSHFYFNPIAWQFLFCIGMFAGTLYNSNEMSLEIFRTRAWVLLACTVVGAGLLYKLGRGLTHFQLLDLDTFALSDATYFQMKSNLSVIRLLHFLCVAFLVAIYVKPNNPILSLPAAGIIIKGGRASLQVFCLGAFLSVILNLFVAVEQPNRITWVILDCATLLLIAWFATALLRTNIRSTQSTTIASEGGSRDRHGVAT